MLDRIYLTFSNIALPEIEKLMKRMKGSELNIFREVLKEASYLTMGNTIVFFLSFFVYPVIGRLFGDVAFAEFAIFQSLVVILQLLPNLGLNEVIYVIKDIFLKLWVKTVYGLTFLVFIALAFCIFVINAVAYDKEYWFIVALLLSVLFASISNTNITFLTREGKIKLVSGLKVVDRVLFVSMTLGLSMFTQAGEALIVSFVIGQLAYVLGTLRTIYPVLQSQIKISTSRLIGSKYSSFVKYSLPSSFVERLSSQIPVLLLPLLTSSALTGQYAMAHKILILPEALIGASIGQIFYRKAAHFYRMKKPMRSLLTRTWRIQILLGIIPFALVMGLGDVLFVQILGNKWSISGEIAQIICISTFLSFVSVPTSSILSIFGKQRYGLYFSITLLLARFFTLYLGITYFSFSLALISLVAFEVLIVLIYNFLSFVTVTSWEDSLN